MIRVVKKDKHVRVSGPPGELMLFYCFWESHLWPDWASSKSDGLDQELKDLVSSINSTGEFHLVTGKPLFDKAFEVAMERFASLGIVVH